MRTKLFWAAALCFVVPATNRAIAQATRADPQATKANAQAVPVTLPSIQTVDYNAHGRFRVNGQPFFPILLYGAPTDEQTLAKLREFGFNTLACRPEECARLPARGFYATVHGATKPLDTSSVLLAIGIDSPALYFQQDLLGRTAKANAKATAGVKNRPVMNAVGYWEDEPAGVVAGKLPSRAHYDDLIAAIDVAAPYLYPVPYQPISTVGDAVARARRATGGKKPVLPILQLFRWDAKARYPTPAELRSMAFLALAEGASGIGYYSYAVPEPPVPPQSPAKLTIADVALELWRSVGPLNRQLAELGPLLFEGDEAPMITLEGASEAGSSGISGVRFKAAGRNHGFPAVLVNPTASSQEGKLIARVPAASGRLHFDGGRKVEVRNGVAMLKLEPLEALILRRFEKSDER